MKKLRLVRLQIQPEFVIDENGTLTPVAVQPMQVNAAEWQNFPAVFEAERLRIENQLNESPNGQKEAPKPSKRALG